MSQDNPDFREDLRWNSYFVDGIYDCIQNEVQIAAQQFEESTNSEISDNEIENIVEEIVDDGLNSLTTGGT